MPSSAAATSTKAKPLYAPTFADFVARQQNVHGATEPLPWWQKPFHRVKTAADLLGCSSTQIYRLAAEGRLVMKRLAGRVVIETSSIVALAQAAEPWEASDRGEAGRRKRAELAAQRWR